MKLIIKKFSSLECFKILSINPNSHLIDVRTEPEWSYVGIPDLSSIKKQALCISWKIYPEMRVNNNFEKQIIKFNIQKNNNLYFICRSGNRSYDAAKFLISKGFTNCFNVSDGFEGKLNQHHKRTSIDGWKFHNLPWKQQ